VPAEGDDSNPWGWILALGLLVVVVVVIVLVLRQRRRRADAASWYETSRRVVSQGALVVSELGTGVSHQAEREPAFQRRLHELDAGLESLRPTAPTSADGQALRDIRAVLADLQAALSADLALRIGPPAPTAVQLSASDAVIVQRVRDLDSALAQLHRVTVDHQG
jgi:hypothetical protein